MLAVPPEQVAAEVARTYRGRPMPPALEPFVTRPERAVAGLADLVRAYWDAALAPSWPRIRALLQGDVLHRARTLADGGARPACSPTWIPRSRGRGGELRIRKRAEASLDLRRRAACSSCRASSSGRAWSRSSTRPGSRRSSIPPAGSRRCGTRAVRRGRGRSRRFSGRAAPPRSPPSTSRGRRPTSPAGSACPRAACPSTCPSCARRGWSTGSAPAARSSTCARPAGDPTLVDASRRGWSPRRRPPQGARRRRRRRADALPAVVADLERRSGRSPSAAPFDGGHRGLRRARPTTAHWRARGRVKIAVPDGDGEVARHEIDRAAPRRLATGCARLLRDDLARGALLLERLGPARCVALGVPVGQPPRDPLRRRARVWRPAARLRPADRRREGAPARPSSSRRRGRRPAGRARSAPSSTRSRARERRVAAHDDERAVLVHGDVHQWNALRGADGFELVDPDGLLAEAEYDLGIMMREDPVDAARRRSAARATARRGAPASSAAAIWEWGAVERVSDRPPLHVGRSAARRAETCSPPPTTSPRPRAARPPAGRRRHPMIASTAASHSSGASRCRQCPPAMPTT